MKLAILYGLKRRIKEAVSEDPDRRVLGTFQNPAGAVQYVDAGGLPDEFPYYAVCLEDGAFWVVAWPGGRPPGMHAPGTRPTILAGPFNNPLMAQIELIWLDKSGWSDVEVSCCSDDWSGECPRGSASRLERPDIGWARARVAKWSGASEVGPVAIALSESGAFMHTVAEWLEAGAPGSDPAFESELLALSTEVNQIHARLHSLDDTSRHRAAGRRGLN